MGLYTIPFLYKSECHKILLLDTFKYHIDFKGFCCSNFKFKKIYDFYKNKVNEFFIGIDYKDRWKTYDSKSKITFEKKIKNFFQKEKNSKNTFYSQDWVRDTCFRKFGMNQKAILSLNIAKNIGDEGVHSNKKLFELEGFDVINNYNGLIDIKDIVQIEQKKIVINNNPCNNIFSLTYKNENTKNFLIKKYSNRFT